MPLRLRRVVGASWTHVVRLVLLLKLSTLAKSAAK
jgi:hypothetical protein